MRKAIIVLSLCFLSLFTFAQKQSIELELMGRYGVQSKVENKMFPIFPYPIITVTGSSIGAGLNYKRMLNKNVYVKAGAGFNRLTADKIKEKRVGGGGSLNTRSFNYTNLGYGYTYSATGLYHYNNLMFTGGAGYEKKLSKNLTFTFGGDIVYLYSITQRYYTGTNKNGLEFNHNEKFSLALALNANAGVLYKIKNGKFYLNPKIVLPVYQRMFADKTLLENNKNDHPQKWLGGGGVSVSMGRYF